MYTNKIFKLIAAFFIAGNFLFTSLVQAETKTFEGSGEYVATDFENSDIAELRAKTRAEQSAISQAVIYLQEYVKKINSNLTDNEIAAIINGTMEELNVQYNSKSTSYAAMVQIRVNTDEIDNWLNRSEYHREMIVNQNNLHQKAVDNNEKNINKLHRQLERTKNEQKILTLQNEINQLNDEFNVNQQIQELNKLYYQNKFKTILPLYSKLIENNPNYINLYMNRGNVYKNLNDYKKATADYNKFIQKNPKNINVLYNLGLVYYANSKYGRAINSCEKIIKINSHYIEAFNLLGASYRAVGNLKKAAVIYSKAIKINPNYAAAYINRAKIYFDWKQYDNALVDLNKYIELMPNDLEGYKCRGFVYQTLENYDNAIKDYDKALEINPEDIFVLQNRAKCDEVKNDR